jgi:outer membrane lipoprotein carrier protein
MKFHRVWYMALLLAAGSAQAALPSPLERFYSGLRGMQADFDQQVVDAHDKVVAHGSGKLSVLRPGQFRWEYQSDGGDQLLLADGKNVWLYEKDLAQATVRAQTDASAATPMMLLSGNAAQLEGAFTFEALPGKAGLDRVEVRPRAASADFSSAIISLRGTALVSMEIRDKLGQAVTLKLHGLRRNPPLSAGLFKFTAPAGVDVIGTALP